MRFASLILAIAFLTACGDEPTPQKKQAAAASKPTASAPAPTPAAAPTDEEELVYDPIDISKLENQWWSQYSAGG